MRGWGALERGREGGIGTAALKNDAAAALGGCRQRGRKRMEEGGREGVQSAVRDARSGAPVPSGALLLGSISQSSKSDREAAEVRGWRSGADSLIINPFHSIPFKYTHEYIK